MYESNCPLKFWDYCVEWRVRVHNLTAKDRLALDGKNPYTATFGEESDISNICNFGFYELVYYWENTDSFPELKRKIGRCLRPCKDEGNKMAQYILKETGRVVARQMVEKIPKSHLKSQVVQEQIWRFNSLIYHKHGTSMNRSSDKQLSKTDYDPINLTMAMPKMRPAQSPAKGKITSHKMTLMWLLLILTRHSLEWRSTLTTNPLGTMARP